MRRVELNSLPREPLSHDTGSTKQVFIRNNVIPHLTQLAQARIPAGTCHTAHTHSDMHEIFVVLEGSGEMQCKDQVLTLAPGVCIHVQPQENHAVNNTGKHDLVLLYFGLMD